MVSEWMSAGIALLVFELVGEGERGRPGALAGGICAFISCPCMGVPIRATFYAYCSQGKAPLHIACTSGHTAVARLLLDKGANKDGKSSLVCCKAWYCQRVSSCAVLERAGQRGELSACCLGMVRSPNIAHLLCDSFACIVRV